MDLSSTTKIKDPKIGFMIKENNFLCHRVCLYPNKLPFMKTGTESELEGIAKENPTE